MKVNDFISLLLIIFIIYSPLVKPRIFNRKINLIIAELPVSDSYLISLKLLIKK